VQLSSVKIPDEGWIMNKTKTPIPKCVIESMLTPEGKPLLTKMLG
jgi:hypothetical protein